MPLVPCVGRQAAAEQSNCTPAADPRLMPDHQLRTENWKLTTGDKFPRDRAYQPPLPPSAAQFLLDHREYAQLQGDSSGPRAAIDGRIRTASPVRPSLC